MGCGTELRGDLREVGLVGCHAYSILDVTEIFDSRLENGHVKLLLVRNPWGQHEWKGDWSDDSALYKQLSQTHKELRISTQNSGAFWISFTHFLMGFGDLDVCFARTEKDGYNAKSFSNTFPLRKSVLRTCTDAYLIQSVNTKTSSSSSSSSSSTTVVLHVMALQPANRGRWCRDDRKVSYKPGDISILILSREKRKKKKKKKWKVEELCMRGGGVVHRRSVAVRLKPNVTYMVVCLNPGTTPAAASKRQNQPFNVRFVCNSPIRVTPFRFNAKKHGKIVLQGFHDALFRRQVRQYNQEYLSRTHPELILSQIGCEMSRKRIGNVRGVEVWSFLSNYRVFVIAARNPTNHRVVLNVQVDAKVSIVRSCNDLGESPLKEDKDFTKKRREEEEEKKIAMKKIQPQNRNKTLKFQALSRVFSTLCVMEAKSERILMIVSPSSRTSHGVSGVRVEAASKDHRRVETSLDSWLKMMSDEKKDSSTIRSCLFESLSIGREGMFVSSMQGKKMSEDEMMKRALEASLQSDDGRLKKKPKVIIDLCDDSQEIRDEEDELRKALEESRKEYEKKESNRVSSGESDSDDGIVLLSSQEVRNLKTNNGLIDNAEDAEDEKTTKTTVAKHPDQAKLRELRLKRLESMK